MLIRVSLDDFHFERLVLIPAAKAQFRPPSVKKRAPPDVTLLCQPINGELITDNESLSDPLRRWARRQQSSHETLCARGKAEPVVQAKTVGLADEIRRS